MKGGRIVRRIAAEALPTKEVLVGAGVGGAPAGGSKLGFVFLSGGRGPQEVASPAWERGSRKEGRWWRGIESRAVLEVVAAAVAVGSGCRRQGRRRRRRPGWPSRRISRAAGWPQWETRRRRRGNGWRRRRLGGTYRRRSRGVRVGDPGRIPSELYGRGSDGLQEGSSLPSESGADEGPVVCSRLSLLASRLSKPSSALGGRRRGGNAEQTTVEAWVFDASLVPRPNDWVEGGEVATKKSCWRDSFGR